MKWMSSFKLAFTRHLQSEAFAEEKCPDTFPLFAKIDVNGENEAGVAFK